MGAVLKELALERSTESRFELLLRLSDYVHERSEILEDDSEQNFVAIAGHVLEQVSSDDRLKFASKAVDFEWLPKALVLKLANGEYNEARPLLEEGEQLDQNDLLEIARKRTTAHRQSIARRGKLSTKVFDQLIELGEEKVFQELVRNTKLKKTPEIFKKLIENSRGMRQFQEEMMMSKTLPSAEFELLGKVLDGSLRLRYVAQKNKRK